MSSNIVSFQLASGGHQCYIMGCYLALDDGYFELPYIGINQGYPLSPTLFNVVVDTAIRH